MSIRFAVHAAAATLALGLAVAPASAAVASKSQAVTANAAASGPLEMRRTHFPIRTKCHGIRRGLACEFTTR